MHVCAATTYTQPQQQQYRQAFVGGGSSGGDENKTIWVGDLQYWMDESYLNSCFGHTNQVNEIMSSFDIGLSQYATKHLTKCGAHLKKGVVKEVHPKKIVISDGTDVPIWPAENVIEEDPVLSVMGPMSPYGLLVWYIGVGSSDFVKSLNLPKSQGGRYVSGFVYHKMSLFWCALLSIKQFLIEHYMIGIDEWMCVPSVEDVFAFGDCAGFLEKIGNQVLPALAQVDCTRYAPGIEILSVHVTKLTIPVSIKRNFEQMEEERTKVLIAMEKQMVAKKELETQKKIALAEAEKNAQMHGELQVLSPLAPIREVNFLRFCKQHAEGVWAVVDVSVDMNRDTSNPQTFVSSRRLPSGCVVQDMPNGYSK
ncbi:hypothetical protein GIB67_005687, partial [Kingdonia uniflora]